jgi:ribosomal protein S18 acetylase RimI-like enzyme
MPDTTATREKDKPLLAQAVDLYDFRPATPEDIPAMVEMYREFFDESYWPGRGMVYDPDRTRKWVTGAINRGDIPHILAVFKQTGEIAGSVCYMLNHTFTTEPFAELNKIYVRPRWRRSAVGRVLMVLCLEIARADGAVSFNAGVAAGMETSASLTNLLTKLGFAPVPGASYLYRRL